MGPGQSASADNAQGRAGLRPAGGPAVAVPISPFVLGRHLCDLGEYRGEARDRGGLRFGAR
eukprot:13103036-Alexandrium_andersonii.AAC.1